MGVEVKRLIGLITQLGLGGYYYLGALPAMAGGFTTQRTLLRPSVFLLSILTPPQTGTSNLSRIWFTGLFKLNFKISIPGRKTTATTSKVFLTRLGLRWRFNRDPAWATAIQGTLILPLGYKLIRTPPCR